mgnify:CR=1 FL=1
MTKVKILEFTPPIRRNLETIVEIAILNCNEELKEKADRKLKYLRKENNRKKLRRVKR